MNHWPADATVMGVAFAQWERLTEEYRRGLDALRRGEAGASVHMARLAQELQRIHWKGHGTSPARDPGDEALVGHLATGSSKR